MLKPLGLLFLVPFAVPLAVLAAETCKPVPFVPSAASPPGLALSADGDWLAAAGPSRVEVFKDPTAESVFSDVPGGEAVSIHGGLLAVGGGGGVRVYRYDGKEWQGPTTLEVFRPNARFGASVAVGDEWIVVGAPEDGAFHEGAAYVYRTDTLELERPLRPNDGRLNDRFGASVAVDGNTFVVGAPYADDLQVYYNFGAAYVFKTGVESPVAKLLAYEAFRQGDIQFGASVAIRGDFIVVGAPGEDLPESKIESVGSAHLFIRRQDEQKQDGWEKMAELTQSNPTPGRQLGASVAIDGAGALVGALGHGSAYFFKLNGAADGECGGCGGRYGRSVALWTRDGKREAFLGDRDGAKGCFKIPEEPKPVLTCKFERPPASLAAGAAATYTVRVYNKGKAPADQVRLVVETTPEVSDGACKAGCSASIPADGEKSFRVTFALPPACEAPESIQPQASAWFETKETKCSSPPPTRIERPLGIQARIEGDGLNVISGKEITYRLRLRNNGPGALLDGAGPEVEHELPLKLALVSWKVVAGGGVFRRAPQPSGDPTETLQWDGSVPPCGTVDLQVTARVPYDLDQVNERVCLEATVKDLDGRKRSATPYCFLIVPSTEITPSEGR